MSERQRRSFTRDFKLAAVKKHVEQGLSAKDVASDLDLDINLIYNWKRAFQADGTLEKHLGSSTSVEAELKRLREENRQLRMERDLLKKATVFFAREKKSDTGSSWSTRHSGPSRFSAACWKSRGPATTNGGTANPAKRLANRPKSCRKSSEFTNCRDMTITAARECIDCC